MCIPPLFGGVPKMPDPEPVKVPPPVPAPTPAAPPPPTPGAPQPTFKPTPPPALGSSSGADKSNTSRGRKSLVIDLNTPSGAIGLQIPT